jgi:D-alanyl-D-alanine dipeptidase
VLDKFPKAQHNRLLLLGIMTAAGWNFYSKEWWHYQLFKPSKYLIETSQAVILTI